MNSEDIQYARKGITLLAQREFKEKNLNETQLQAIFMLLTHSFPVEYKENEGWFIKEEYT